MAHILLDVATMACHYRMCSSAKRYEMLEVTAQHHVMASLITSGGMGYLMVTAVASRQCRFSVSD